MLEIIKNILLSLAAIFFIIVGFIIFIKIYYVLKQIKNINEKIEQKQIELDNNEVNNIGSFEIDILGSNQKYERSIKQEIRRLREKKRCLLEEISIYKIFKK